MAEKALLWHIAKEFDFLKVLRENEHNIELNSTTGLSVRSLSLKLENYVDVGINSNSLRPKLLCLCDRGLVFFERGVDGSNSQQINLYRLSPVVIEYLDSCDKFLKGMKGDSE